MRATAFAVIVLLVTAASCRGGDANDNWQSLAELVQGRGYSNTDTPFARFPASAKDKIPKSVWDLSHQSAGLYVHFVTDATAFKVRWALTSGSLAMPHMPATGVSGIDLYARGAERNWMWIANGRPSGQSNTASFANLPGKTGECLLYLPLYNGVSALEISLPEGTKLQAVPARPERSKPIVIYGTSITQGACASRPGLAFTSIVSRRIDWPVVNLGFSGSGRMEPEMADLIAEIDARVLVLDCLWNMTPQLVDERIEPFIMTIRKSHPELPILLLEDSDFRARTPTTKGAKLKAIFDRLSQTDRNLHFLGARDLLGVDGEATVEGCHPNDIGMLRHADAIAPVLKKILGLAQ
ncbi:MAG TPA: SGNH/GDSL hydrolase family protein [Planctomycetota bacterium]|jgi:hypothetical protein